MNNKKSIGRPQGKLKNDRLNVMISSELKKEFQKVATENGSNISVKTCELITEYIKNSKESK